MPPRKAAASVVSISLNPWQLRFCDKRILALPLQPDLNSFQFSDLKMSKILDLSGMLYILSADLHLLYGCRLKPLEYLLHPALTSDRFTFVSRICRKDQKGATHLTHRRLSVRRWIHQFASHPV